MSGSRAEGWWDNAVCRQIGPGPWDEETAAGAGRAKRLCREVCPVRDECLEHAMEREAGRTDLYRGGIWGGLGPKQRYELARRPSTRPDLRVCRLP